jgi:hypothetical protein
MAPKERKAGFPGRADHTHFLRIWQFQESLMILLAATITSAGDFDWIKDFNIRAEKSSMH